MAQGVVEVLLGKVISLLENETSILRGIRGEFNEVKSELESMKFFLSDAYRRGVTNQGIRTWVEQVRDVAYDVEDVMDEFMYFVSGQRRITNFMGKQMNTIKNAWMRRKIASRLRAIQTQVKTISERSKRYRFGHIEATNPSDTGQKLPRSESLPFKEDEIFGGH
ncbi:hypothetical protein IFM89_012113 [Coptis chinensis]|uniref:Disease resistance N-terminal domain-containing protein n=1 Tax=Coptis chinensis TaxID=261450 RepID=A0A835HXV1_9MAGN|nr:hypothetical protein IFM89_012113 [Coptis chinensis]